MAIDVGYGNTKYVRSIEGGQIRCAQFPSVAAISDEGAKRDAIGGRRKTVALAIDSLIYEVGPDVHLVAGNGPQAQNMDDNYCERPEYLALVRGALSMMDIGNSLDLLVVGLPVATFKFKRAILERRLRGEHDIGDGQRVIVDRVKVVAQPLGALVQFGAIQRRLAQIKRERTLIVDSGSRTFDWLVTQGLRVVEARSHSINRGMHDVVRKLAERIGRAEGIEITDFDRIDVALRTRTKPKINGQEHDLAPHMKAAQAITAEAVGELKGYVGNGHDIDNIVVVGGGAVFFAEAIKKEFPKRELQLLAEPMFANVKGFQLAGMDLLRTGDGVEEQPSL
jgi:plasmid segregation protein ParM